MAAAAPSFYAVNADDSGAYNRLGAWFAGPKGENAELFKSLVARALDSSMKVRRDYQPEDKPYVTQQVKDSAEYKDAVATLETKLTEMTKGLAARSVPFWSMRYLGHMNWETTLPGIVGYMAALPFNQNNVAYEGSPYTSELEMRVGVQLTDLLFNPTESGGLEHWGHITCDGTVANIEATWAARNLKYYPLSIQQAFKDEGGALFGKDIKVNRINGGVIASLANASAWQLLNLDADEILSLPAKIADKYEMDITAVGDAITKHSLQQTGWLLQASTGLPAPVMLVPATKHYSWPKAAALTGVGGKNAVDVVVDDHARISISALRTLLEKYLELKQPVLMVVAVIGTTIEGAVDDLNAVCDLREEFRKKGLNFSVHADAAWGGYFKTMITEPPQPRGPQGEAVIDIDPFVPAAVLSPHTAMQLAAIERADSATIDPHKSGYIPYPAGFLGYRNRSMRDLLTYAAPYIIHGDLDVTLAIFGVEGSKPGAAAAAVWLSHEVIPLNTLGYGRLLGQAMFTNRKIFAKIATLAEDEDNFLIEPLNVLPTEVEISGQMQPVSRADIRLVSNLTNRNLMSDQHAKSKEILKLLGSDLAVNMYGLNFKIPLRLLGGSGGGGAVPVPSNDGNTEILVKVVNADLNRANVLVKHVFNDVSLSPGDVTDTKKVFLTQSELNPAVHGDIVARMKRNLKLKDPAGVPSPALATLVNTVMCPWASAGPLIDTVGAALRDVIRSNIAVPGYHKFVVLRTGQAAANDAEDANAANGHAATNGDEVVQTVVFLDALARFNVAEHRFQAIVEAQLPETVLQQYDAAVKAGGVGQPLILTNSGGQEAVLDDIVFYGGRRGFGADLFLGLPLPDGSNKLATARCVVLPDPVRYTPFDPFGTHPKYLQYILYGIPGLLYMSKQLLVGMDFQQVVVVKLANEGDLDLVKAKLRGGVVLSFPGLPTFGPDGQVNLDDQLVEGRSYTAEVLGEQPSVKIDIQVEVKIYYDQDLINKKLVQ